MFKKVVWILILLVMTACTIVISEQMDYGKKSGTPAALEPFEPTEGMEMLSKTVDTASSAVADIEFPSLPLINGEGINKSVPLTEGVEIDFPPLVSAPESESTDLTTTDVTAKVASFPKYIVQDGTPSYMENFNYLDKGCEWQGVAGQVFGKDNAPVKYLIVKVFGTWNGEEVSKMAVTGMLKAKAYGKGGYEIELGDVAIKSTEPLSIQIFRSDGTPLSEPFQFMTKAKCSRNLVIINFVKK